MCWSGVGDAAGRVGRPARDRGGRGAPVWGQGIQRGEQVNADLIDGPLAHLPSGHFGANGAWLACAGIAHNLTRTAGHLAAGGYRAARAATIRTRINVAARLAHRARAIHLHLPERWPWQHAWHNLFTAVHALRPELSTSDESGGSPTHLNHPRAGRQPSSADHPWPTKDQQTTNRKTTAAINQTRDRG